MISGPVAPHPRILLADLLEDGDGRAGSATRGPVGQGPTDALAVPRPSDLLEAGLDLFELDVRLGEELQLDFLGCDAAGAPVAVLAVAEDDCRELPLRLLDVDLWFRENAFLMRRGLGMNDGAWTRLRWDIPHRLMLVTAPGLDPRFYQRLEGLSALPLTVRELRSVFVRGERHWYARGVAPWSEDLGEIRDASAPAALHDRDRVSLVEDLLTRLPALSPLLEVLGDARHRQVLLAGEPLLRLICTDNEVRCWLPIDDRSLLLSSRRDVDEILDSLLRDLLARDTIPGRNGMTRDEPSPSPSPSAWLADDRAEAAAPEPVLRLEPEGVAGLEPASLEPASAGRRSLAQPGPARDPRARRGRVAYATGILGPATRQPLPPLPEAEDLGPKLSDEELDAFLDS